MKIIKGKSVHGGVAIGKMLVWKNASAPETPAICGDGNSWQSYIDAKKKADEQLEALYNKTKSELGEEQALIIDVQRLMLEDGDFHDALDEAINKEGKSALDAVKAVGAQFVGFFEALDDEYMKARALDVSDITKRLVRILAGVEDQFTLLEPVIIVAEDLTPSETLQLDRSKILGFVTQKGSANSHTAILAGVLNIPSLIQVDIELDDKLGGRIAVVDGEDGVLYLDPDDSIAAVAEEKKAEIERRRLELYLLKDAPTVTKDGRKIDLFANAGNTSDIADIINNGAEGIGLFRSEFLFLEADDYPSEEEQYAAYRKVAEAMGDKKVIIRTLDIGADKKVDYFGLEQEENPALGFRAIRICLERPELFKTQLRAIYRAAAHGNVSVMFPMIASLWEVVECKKVAAEVAAELSAENIPFGTVGLGIMIETPAAVMMADEIGKEVDFFSVGTNDLTQYTLAIDRQSGALDRFYDPHHPAVVKMLEMVAKAAESNGIWAGICGELAADTSMTEAFIDMGYSELSVSAGHILEIRKKVRSIHKNAKNS